MLDFGERSVSLYDLLVQSPPPPPLLSPFPIIAYHLNIKRIPLIKLNSLLLYDYWKLKVPFPILLDINISDICSRVIVKRSMSIKISALHLIVYYLIEATMIHCLR